MRKEKEYVVIYLDCCLYGCDVADDQRIVINLTRNGLFYHDRIITCQITEVIHLLCNNYGGISRFDLLDFECLDLQIRQSVEHCEEQNECWSPHEMVLYYTGRELPLRPEEQHEEALRLMIDCYQEMKRRGEEEWPRIEKIEIPVNRVLYDLVARGIEFRNDQLEEFCQVQHKKLYRALNRIQLDFGQVQPNLEALYNQLNLPIHYLKYGRLKALCKKYPKLQPFRDAEKAERNLRILTYLSAIRKNLNIVTPVVKPVGSRTSRIILRNPSLQNMSKEFRELFNCSHQTFVNHRYLYVDYSQFEAGILAGLTNRKELISLYEKNRIYSEIERIANCDRSEAKILFYCFIYGGVCAKKLKGFFNRYCSEDDLESLVNAPKVSSLLGNSRILNMDTDCHKILNHRIQSIGSLIFKQALIDVYNRYRWKVDLVLPLHDGALYKIIDDEITDEDICRIYREAFRKYFPGLSPLVKPQQFFPEGE